MKINTVKYLYLVNSLLMMSCNIIATELTQSPYDTNQRQGPIGFYRSNPGGVSFGVYRQGNIEYLPYNDSKGATGMYERLASYEGLKPDSESQGAVVFLGNADSPTMRDPAIRYYNSQKRIITAEDLQARMSQPNIAEDLFKCNYLDLSNFNLSASGIAAFLSQADLSTVREINISCSPEQGTIFNANDFLKKLFENNTLRSLISIDARGSNINKATLEILRTKTDLNEPLIRDMWKLDEASGKKVASIEISISNTPIASLETLEKRQLLVPGESRLSVLYRSSDYFPGSAAHLQLFLK